MQELPRHKLSEAELQEAMTGLPGWRVAGGKLHREYEFEDFVHAFGFMTGVALMAESMRHHPEWSNVYSKVVLDLWTHSESAISNLDVELAGKVEQLARVSGS